MCPRDRRRGDSHQRRNREDEQRLRLRELRPPPRLRIVLELEGVWRVFLESDSWEDSQRLLVTLRDGDAIEALHALADDLEAYVREATS
jgi:hypothetical protein